MNTTDARKVILLCWLVILGVYTFGGLWGTGSLPHPRKYLGATIAYMGLAVAVDFVPPVAMAFAILFGLYILLQSLPEVNALGLAASPTSTAGTQPMQSVNAATSPSTHNLDTPTTGGLKNE